MCRPSLGQGSTANKNLILFIISLEFKKKLIKRGNMKNFIIY
jgi:hypothetical protein